MSRSGPVHTAMKPRSPKDKKTKCCGADTKSRHPNERQTIRFEPVLPEWAELAETNLSYPTEPLVSGVTFAGTKCSQMKVVKTEPEAAATEKHQLIMIIIKVTIIRYSNDPSDWLLIG